MGMLYEYEALALRDLADGALRAVAIARRMDLNLAFSNTEAEQSEQTQRHPALFGDHASESSSRPAQSWSASEDGGLGVRDVGPDPPEPTKEE